MKLLILALFVFLSGLAESKSLRDNKSKNAAVDDVYNADDSYEYEYEYDDIDEGIMFECLDGSGNKIMLDYMCNGFSECDDGSDEDIVNCAVHGISKETTTTTSTTTTTTATTTPVPTTTTSTKAVKIEEPDEFDDYQDACSADEFQCKSDLGICLPKALVCDGTKDCPNSEDETDCPSDKGLLPSFKTNKTVEDFTISPTGSTQPQITTSPSPVAHLCSSLRSFQCRSRPGDCVPKFLLCDGFKDCLDGSDEERCTCNPGEFRCLNRKCVKAHARCNGVNDCGDFSDEILGCMIDPPRANEKLSTTTAQQNFTTTGTENHITTPSHISSALPTNSSEELTTPESRPTIHTTNTVKTSSNNSTDSSKTPDLLNKWRFCSLEPCANGGRCFENENAFVCVCTSDYKGPTCMQRRSKNLNGDLGNGSVSSFSKGLLSFTYIPLSVIFFLNILL